MSFFNISINETHPCQHLPLINPPHNINEQSSWYLNNNSLGDWPTWTMDIHVVEWGTKSSSKLCTYSFLQLHLFSLTPLFAYFASIDPQVPNTSYGLSIREGTHRTHSQRPFCYFAGGTSKLQVSKPIPVWCMLGKGWGLNQIQHPISVGW